MSTDFGKNATGLQGDVASTVRVSERSGVCDSGANLSVVPACDNGFAPAGLSATAGALPAFAACVAADAGSEGRAMHVAATYRRKIAAMLMAFVVALLVVFTTSGTNTAYAVDIDPTAANDVVAPAGSTETTFMKDMPGATIVIDNAELEKWQAGIQADPSSIKNFLTIRNSNFQYFDTSMVGQPGFPATMPAGVGSDGGKTINYNKVNQHVIYKGPITASGETTVAGDVFDIKIPNVAILEDGSRGDVLVTFSDVHIFTATSNCPTQEEWNALHVVALVNVDMQTGVNGNRGLQFDVADAMPQSPAGNKRWHIGTQQSATFKVVQSGTNTPVNGTFIYPMKDVDVKRDNANYMSIYRADINDNFSETIRVDSGAASKIYTPATNTYNHIYKDSAGGIRFAANNGSDDDTYNSGFAVVANANGFRITGIHGAGGWYSGNVNSINTPILRGQYYHKIASSTTAGGTIQTTTRGNAGGGLNDGGELHNGGYIVVGDHKSVTYTMKPKPGYKIDRIVVDGRNVSLPAAGATSRFRVDNDSNNSSARRGYVTGNADGSYTFEFRDNIYDHAIHVSWVPLPAQLTGNKHWEDYFQRFRDDVLLHLNAAIPDPDGTGTYTYKQDFHLPAQKITTKLDGSKVWGSGRGFEAADGTQIPDDSGTKSSGTNKAQTYGQTTSKIDTTYKFWEYDFDNNEFVEYEYDVTDTYGTYAGAQEYSVDYSYAPTGNRLKVDFLPKYDTNGNQIIYTVTEDPIKGYDESTETNKNGSLIDYPDPAKALFEYTITNTQEPVATVGIKIDKALDGRAYVNGEEYVFVLSGLNDAPMPIESPAQIPGIDDDKPETVVQKTSATSGTARTEVDFGIIAINKADLNQTQVGYGQDVTLANSSVAFKATDAQKKYIDTWTKDHGNGTRTVYASSIPDTALATFAVDELNYGGASPAQRDRLVWVDATTNTYFNQRGTIPAHAVSVTSITYGTATDGQKEGLIWLDPTTGNPIPTGAPIPDTAIAYTTFSNSTDAQKEALVWKVDVVDEHGTVISTTNYVFGTNGIPDTATNLHPLTVTYSAATDAQKALAQGDSADNSRWKSQDGNTTYTTDTNIPDDAVGTLHDNTFTYRITENPQHSPAVENDTNIETVEVYAVYDEKHNAILLSAEKDNQGKWITGKDATATLESELSKVKIALNPVSFRNVYDSTNTWTPTATKVLNGRPLERDQFNFKMHVHDQSDAQVAQNLNSTGWVTYTPFLQARNINGELLYYNADGAMVTLADGGIATQPVQITKVQTTGADNKDKTGNKTLLDGDLTVWDYDQDVVKDSAATTKGTDDLYGPVTFDDVAYTNTDLAKRISYDGDKRVVYWRDGATLYGPIPEDATNREAITIDGVTYAAGELKFGTATEAQREAAGSYTADSVWQWIDTKGIVDPDPAAKGMTYTKVVGTILDTDGDGKAKYYVPNAAGKMELTGTPTGLGVYYETERTFKYVMWEVKDSSDKGLTTYDTNAYTDTNKPATAKDVEVTISESTSPNGTLKVTKPTAPVFSNKYEAKGTVNLKATKALDDRSEFGRGTFSGKQTFKFKVEAVTDTKVGVQTTNAVPLPTTEEQTITPTSGNTADIDFGNITFTHADFMDSTGKYYVAERTKDGDYERTFVYKITETDITGNAAGAEGMENENSPSAEARNTLLVSITVREDKYGNITVVAVNGADATEIAANDKFEKERIGFTVDKPGSKNYPPNIKSTYEAESTVKAGTVYNTYQASGELELTATKKIEGSMPLKANMFYFELRNAKDNSVVDEKPNAADGSITFNNIVYNLSQVRADADAGLCEGPGTGKTDMAKNGPWTYTYKLKELIPADGAKAEDITYDDTEYTITVEVKDNGDGTLTATVKEPTTALEFTNKFPSVEITGTKKWVDVETITHNNANEVKLTLLRQADGGTAVETVTKDADDINIEVTWDNNNFTINNLPKYSTDGKKYTYWVTESTVDGYGAPKYENLDDPNTTANEANIKDKALNHGTVVNTVLARGEYTIKAKKILKGSTTLEDWASNPFKVTAKEENSNYTTTPEASIPTNGTLEKLNNGEIVSVSDEFDVATLRFKVFAEDEGGGVENFIYLVNEQGAKLGNTYVAKLENGSATLKINESEAAGIANVDQTYARDITLNLTITDNGDGTLSIEPAPSSAEIAELVNDHAAEVKAAIPVEKALDGRALNNGEFVFTATYKPDPALSELEAQRLASGFTAPAEVTNDANGKAAFTVKFTKTGTYTFTIAETKGGLGGVTYDESTHDVTVTVTNDKGELKAAVSPSEAVKFKNTYSPTGSATIAVTKDLEGIDWDDDMNFWFRIKDTSGIPITNWFSPTPEFEGEDKAATKNRPTVSWTIDGFDKTALGKTYTFTIEETNPNHLPDEEWTLDTSKHTATLTFADDGHGTLVPTVKYDATPASAGSDTLVVTNTKKGNGRNIHALKKLVDSQAQDIWVGGASFTLRLAADEAGSPMPADAQSGAKEVAVTKDAPEANFGTIMFDVTNPLIAQMPNDSFKDFTYTISEVAPSPAEAGYTYDGSTYKAQVTVTKGASGAVSVTDVSYFDSNNQPLAERPAFTNTFKAKGEVALGATKVLDGGNLADFVDDFTFTLYEADGTTVAKDKDGNDISGKKADSATGTISLGSIAYDEGDLDMTNDDGSTTKTYILREDAGNKAGITYDTADKAITVELKIDGEAEPHVAKIAATQTGPKPTITNSYNPTGQQVFTVLKHLDNRPITRAGFYFEIEGLGTVPSINTSNPEDGLVPGSIPVPAHNTTHVGATTTNFSPYGSASFGAIPYTMADLATAGGAGYEASRIFVYKIYETKGTNTAIDYDDNSKTDYYAFVTVTNDLVNGALTATPTYVKHDVKAGTYAAANEMKFTNVYDSVGTATVNPIKQIIGREWTGADKFDFTIKAYEGMPSTIGGGTHEYGVLPFMIPLPGNQPSATDPIGNKGGSATGSATINGRDVGNGEHFADFEPITFTDGMLTWDSTDGYLKGTFFYVITENTPVPGGFEQTGTTTFYAQVDVVDDRVGGITHHVYYYDDASKVGYPSKQMHATPVFQNTYKLDVEAALPITKAIDGRDWKADDSFSFTIDNLNEAPLPASRTLDITNATPNHTASYEIPVTLANLTSTTTTKGELKYTGGAEVDKGVKYAKFRYEIDEAHAGETREGLVYADKIFVEALVIDKLDGTLDTQVAYYSDATFSDAAKLTDGTLTNVYDAIGAPVELEVAKAVVDTEGADAWNKLEQGASFTVELEALNGAPVTREYTTNLDDLPSAPEQTELTLDATKKSDKVSVLIRMSDLNKNATTGEAVETSFVYKVVERPGSVTAVKYDTDPLYVKVTATPNNTTKTVALAYTYFTDAACTQERAEGSTITNTYGVSDLKVEKVWNDGGATQHPDIELYLTRSIGGGASEILHALPDGATLVDKDKAAVVYDDGAIVAADKLPVTFADLPAFTADGQAITYSVDEDAPDNYVLTDIAEENGTVTLTNTLLTKVPVTKVWHDGNSPEAIAARPQAIIVGLVMNNGLIPIDFRAVRAEEGWQTAFEYLPAYDQNGQKISYTIMELGVPADFSSVVTGVSETGYTITNTKLEDVTVEKTWIGGAVADVEYKLYRSAHPSEASRLHELDDGRWEWTVDGSWTEVDTHTFASSLFEYKTAEQGGDTKSFTFSGLPAYDEAGAAYIYRVKEVTESSYFVPTQPVDLAVINTNAYEAVGTAKPNVVKELAGREWMDTLSVQDKFYFKIEGVDVTDADGNPVQVAGVKPPLPEDAQGTEQPVAFTDKSKAQVGAIGRSVDFDAITFTNEDMLNDDGSTAAVRNFNYKIYEVADADGNPLAQQTIDGITYAGTVDAVSGAFVPTVHTLRIEVTDNGDGTLSTNRYWDGATTSGAVPVYTNTYSSASVAKIWIEKKIETRGWQEYANGAGDAFQFDITAISGSRLNVPGTDHSAGEDSYTTMPLVSNAKGNPQPDLQKLSDTEYAFGVTGNPYTGDMLNSEGEAYFIYAIDECASATSTTDTLGLRNYVVDGLQYDPNTIYLRLHVKDNWDGTLSFEAKYYEDAACTKEISGREVWIEDKWEGGVETKRLLSADEAAAAEAMTPEQQAAAGYRKVNVAYFTNTTTADVPVKKVWADGPAVEDVTVHLQRALFTLAAEPYLTPAYVEQHADWKLVGLSHSFQRGEFADASEATYTFEDLPQYVTENGTTYRAVYKLTEDNTSDAYTPSYTDQIFINPGTTPTVTNTVTATNQANIAAVKQLLGRDWLAGDDFAFTLEPIGKGKYKDDGTFDGIEQTTDIPMPATDESRKSKTEGAKATTHATPDTSIVDTEGKLERLARFGAISYQVSDLVYDPTDRHYQGDFFYKMIEVVPAEGQGAEGVTYSTKESTVHVKVRENRTDALTVQVAYDETTQGDITTGTQFTPVFTNVYNSSSEAEVFVVKQLVGKDWEAESFEFKIEPVSGTKGDGTTVPAADMPKPTSDKATASDKTEPVGYNEHNAKFAPIAIHLSDLAVDPADGVTKGDFTYKVVEVVPIDTGNITYDTTEHLVTIHATSTGHGEVSTSVSWDGRPVGDFVPVYVNTYTSPTTTIETAGGDPDPMPEDPEHKTDPFFVKKVAGDPGFPADAKSKDFAFTLAAVGDAPAPTNPGPVTVTVNKVDTEFAIDFGTITFDIDDLAGKDTATFTYKLVEQKEAGWQHNAATTEGVTIEVTLAKQADGSLKATWTKQAVENVYGADEQVSSPTGEDGADLYKELAGKGAPALKPGMFRFQMKGLAATPNVSTKDASGTYYAFNGNPATGEADGIFFGPIGFTETGTYAFELVELKGDLPGVTYDDGVRTLVCAVTDDDADGTFEFDWNITSGTDTFTNTYAPVEVTVDPLPATKTLYVPEGSERTLEEAEFHFAIQGGDQTKVFGYNKAADAGEPADIVWRDITFSTDDLIDEDGNFVTSRTFTYSIYELSILGDPTIAYDGIVYMRTITLTWENGKLTASWDDGENVAFENYYMPDGTPSSPTGVGNLVITKEISDADGQGRTPKANEFLFQIVSTVGEDEFTLLGTNKADGTVEFPSFFFYEAGTYTFTIKELAGQDPTIATYDATEYTAVATVTDDGTGELAVAWKISQKNGAPVEGDNADKAATFTNVTEPKATALSVTKVWAGDLEPDGTPRDIRPDKVTVQLQSKVGQGDWTNVEGKTLELAATGKWTGEFADLPAYDDAGNRISYQAVELDVPEGYTSTPVTLFGVTVVTNTAQSEKITVKYEVTDPQTGETQTVVEKEINRGEDEPAAPTKDPSKEGYTFMGWKRTVDSETGDVTYEAQWKEIEKASITHDPNNGEDATTITIEKGTNEPGQPADPENGDKTFGGWDRTQDENGNVIYKARWIDPPTPEEITVIYKDGETTIRTETIEKGGTESEQPADPTKKGFRFTGWHRTTDADGSVTYDATWEKIPEVTITHDPDNGEDATTVTIYNDGTEPPQPADPKNGDKIFGGWDRSEDENGNVIYKARWIDPPTPEEITVTYKDGETTIRTETIEKGGTESEQPADPTKEGFRFTGWHRTTDADGNVTYDATWEKIPEVTITHDPGNGDEPTVDTRKKGENEPGQPADPTRDGYTFGGWDRTQDENGNVIYKARWIPVPTPPEPEKVTITYDPDNGDPAQTNTIDRGADEPAAPEDPKREGYTFGGWERTTDPATGNVTYKAKWLPESATVPVLLEWDDANNQDGQRPDQVVVKLLDAKGEPVLGPDGKPVEAVLSEDNNWTHNFEGLPVVDAEGKVIEYQIAQVTPSGYTETIVKGDDGTFTITDSYTPDVVTLKAIKVWDGEPDSIGQSLRGDVVLHLYGSLEGYGIVYDGGERTIKLGAEGDEAIAQWKDMPKHHYNDEPLTWEIVEEAMFGYVTSYEWDEAGTTFTVTNTYAGPTTKVTATKVWDDADDIDGVRPESVKLKLVKKVGNGEVEAVDEKVANAENGWRVEWTNLPVTELVEAEQGGGESVEPTEEPVLYSVEEAMLPPGSDYESMVVATAPGEFEVVNARQANTTSVKVRKTWIDDNNADGIRPDFISITILRDGKEYYTDTLTVNDAISANVWEAVYENLPANTEKGKASVYTVVEGNVDGYSATMPDPEDGTLSIVNTHSATAKALKATKVWKDADGKTIEKAPTDATFHLMKVVEGTGPIRVEGKDKTIKAGASGEELVLNWTGLPGMEDGRSVTYTVEEDAISGYTTSYSDGTNKGATINVTVTNTQVPGPEQITVTYTAPDADEPWEDVSATINRGDDEPAQPADPTREGYIFGGWERATDPKTGNVTYTAKWIVQPAPGQITVTYKDGDRTIESKTINRGEDEPAQPADPTKEGYTFGGWLRTVDDKGNVTYTAHWVEKAEPAQDQPRVIYVDPKAADGAMALGAAKYASAEEAAKAAEDRAGAPTDPTHEGYTFVGWALSQDELGDWVMVAKYNEVTPTPEAKTVSYIDMRNGEPMLVTVTTDDPSSVKPPENIETTKDGMTFTGWQKLEDAEGNILYIAKFAADCANPKPTPAPTPTPAASTVTRTTTAAGTPVATTPRTSDEAPIALLAALAAASAAGTLVARRRITRTQATVQSDCHRRSGS